MASTVTAWSPTSLQLRLAINSANSKKYRPIFGWARLETGKVGCVFHLNKRFVVVQERGTNWLERKMDGGLRVRSDSTADGFSGWSENDDDPISVEPERNKWFIGAIGAGVGGVILLTGITFAALSLNKQKASRTKQQMVPLTAEQQFLISSDERNDPAKKLISESDHLKQENEISLTQKDTDRDYSSRDYNITDDADGATSTRDTQNVSDAANIVSHHEGLQHGLAPDDAKLDIPVENSSSLDVAELQNAGDSLVISDSKELDVAGKTSEEISVNVERIPSSYYDDNSQEVNTEVFDEMLGLAGDQSTSPSLGTLIGSSMLANVSVNSKSNTTSEPDVLSRGHEDDILSPSCRQNLNLNGSSFAGKKDTTSQDVGQFSETGQYRHFASSSSPNVDDDGNGVDKVDKISSYSPSSGIFFSAAGIPAPSEVTTSHQEVPGKVLVPAVVDQIQGQALAALQVLKVIEADAQPGDLCTRREYARWLVSATSALSRNPISKVYPAMYIENVTELAFDDIVPDDPDFPSIQGLAEAGFIASKLSRRDMNSSSDKDQSPFYFFPGSPLSRQDLVSWKMAIEKKQLPVADRKVSGFIDVDKVHPDACPAIVADLTDSDQGIIGLAFGYTRLFQPNKLVTKAQAAIALATGEASDIVNEELARIDAESAAEKAVSTHNALVAEVEKDINANFEREILIEKEKIAAVERMAEEAKQELEMVRAEREQDNIALMKERAVVESEMELLSRLRRELEDQLQSLMNNKVEISYEKEQIGKIREQTERENQEIARLQYELEVERKALSMARSWAEDEAKRAREQAKALEEARSRWEKQGIKVVVDDDLREEAYGGVTWLTVGKQVKVEETVDRAESLVVKLKAMAASVEGKSRDVINKIIQKIRILISNLKHWTKKVGQQTGELKDAALSNIRSSTQGWQRSTQELSMTVKEGAKRAVGDCREVVEKITQKFKT